MVQYINHNRLSHIKSESIHQKKSFNTRNIYTSKYHYTKVALNEELIVGVIDVILIISSTAASLDGTNWAKNSWSMTASNYHLANRLRVVYGIQVQSIANI